MQEASVQGFVRTILIFILIYYAFKIIGRFVFPVIVKRFVGKFEQKVKDQEQQQNSNQEEKIGETIIDKKPNSNKKTSNDVGEYVDFEEVDE